MNSTASLRVCWLCLLGLLHNERVTAAIVYPDTPDKSTQVNKDVSSDIQTSVGSRGKLEAGEVEVKTEVAAKNLCSKYPHADRVLIAQPMAPTYCS